MSGNEQQVRVVKCAQCGSSIDTFLGASAVSIVCKHCGSTLDARNPAADIIHRLLARQSNRVRKMYIPLGAMGKIHGTQFLCSGYIERRDKESGFIWSEYLLWNPLKGFRWLTENNGHWSYVTMIKDQATIESGVARLRGVTYKQFQYGIATVNYVEGEFYWKVKYGDSAVLEDYIRPPETLSVERSQSEIVLSLCQYLDPEAVKNGFGLKNPLPVPKGIAPNQPNDKTQESAKVWSDFWVYCGILFVWHFVLLHMTNRSEFMNFFLAGAILFFWATNLTEASRNMELERWEDSNVNPTDNEEEDDDEYDQEKDESDDEEEVDNEYDKKKDKL
jgi:hypothetical protein